MTIALILLIVALVLFLLATFNIPSPINLVAAGLVFVVLAQLVGTRIL